MAETKTIPNFEELLEQSSVTKEFADAARKFAADRQGSDRIRFNAGSPAVKVQRVLMQLLDKRPNLAVDSIAVEGQSGCSDFRGTLRVKTAEKEQPFRFVWDCAWKAQEMGWKSFWGDPDQQRAAQSFGYQCFEIFEETGE